MLALPVIKGGIRSKDRLVSTGCAKGPWQNSCKDDHSQCFEAAFGSKRCPSCYVSKRKN